MIEVCPSELKKIVAQMSSAKNFKLKFHIKNGHVCWFDSKGKENLLLFTRSVTIETTQGYYGGFDVTPTVIDLVKLTIESIERKYKVTDATVEVNDVLDYIEKNKYKREVYVF